MGYAGHAPPGSLAHPQNGANSAIAYRANRKETKVRSVVFKSPHLQRWLAGMAISVFGLSTVAAVVVQIPSSIVISAVGKRPAPVAESTFVDSDCADCGSIESNRVVETHLAPARPAKLAAR